MSDLSKDEIEILEAHHARLQTYANVLFYGESGEQLAINPLKRTKLMLGFYVSTNGLPAKQPDGTSRLLRA